MNKRFYLLAIVVIAVAGSLGCGCGDDDDDADHVDDDDTGVGDDDSSADDDVGDDDGGFPDDDFGDDDVPSPALAIDCADDVDDVYLTPSDLPPYQPSFRGEIVRCAFDSVMTREELEDRFGEIEGLEFTSGFTAYVIAYRTERRVGEEGVGTARILLPDTPAKGPLPLVNAAHGTAGLADDCAPSKHQFIAEGELSLPWAAAGYPVVAPDYAGLGNEGTQGYVNTPDTVHSVVDAARAMIGAVTPGSMSGKVIVIGHSQGGGAVLGTQALEQEYAAPDITISAAVSFAGGYALGLDANVFKLPNTRIDSGAGVTRVVMAMIYYADFANLFGFHHARDPLHPNIRDYVGDAIETRCVFDLALYLQQATADYTPPDTLGELLDPAFRESIVDCLDGTDCSADDLAWIERAGENDRPLDPAGAPVLLVAGGQDQQQPPWKQGCLKESLEEWGIAADVCFLEEATHYNVVASGISLAMRWALTGEFDCPSDADLPACPFP
ncbi:MAG: alpha/beta fold hydrolase [Deltaproteobacteria bacterium]|nr:alpha/beta fold hydrolase [Deltaproteobacteria bacterium]